MTLVFLFKSAIWKEVEFTTLLLYITMFTKRYLTTSKQVHNNYYKVSCPYNNYYIQGTKINIQLLICKQLYIHCNPIIPTRDEKNTDKER